MNKGNKIIDKTFYHVGSVIPGLIFTYMEFILLYLIFINNKFNPVLPNIIWLVISIVMVIINILSFWHISDIKTKLHKIIYYISTTLSVIIKVTVIFTFFVAFLYTSPIKNMYETTMINNKDYVILSEYNQKYLVAEYKNIDTNTIFYTSEYQLINNEGLVIRFSSFENIECN